MLQRRVGNNPHAHAADENLLAVVTAAVPFYAVRLILVWRSSSRLMETRLPIADAAL